MINRILLAIGLVAMTAAGPASGHFVTGDARADADCYEEPYGYMRAFAFFEAQVSGHLEHVIGNYEASGEWYNPGTVPPTSDTPPDSGALPLDRDAYAASSSGLWIVVPGDFASASAEAHGNHPLDPGQPSFNDADQDQAPCVPDPDDELPCGETPEACIQTLTDLVCSLNLLDCENPGQLPCGTAVECVQALKDLICTDLAVNCDDPGQLECGTVSQCIEGIVESLCTFGILDCDDLGQLPCDGSAGQCIQSLVEFICTFGALDCPTSESAAAPAEHHSMWVDADCLSFGTAQAFWQGEAFSEDRVGYARVVTEDGSVFTGQWQNEIVLTPMDGWALVDDVPPTAKPEGRFVFSAEDGSCRLSNERIR